MGLTFEHVVRVKAPADRVWAYLTDPRRVATALPGAAVTEKVDERTYAGTITVKVGPVSAKYRGSVALREARRRRRATAEIVGLGPGRERPWRRRHAA